MERDPIQEANDTLLAKGYRDRRQLGVFAVAVGSGRALLKGSRLVSPLADSAERVLQIVRECVPPLEELGTRALTPRELRERLDQR